MIVQFFGEVINIAVAADKALVKSSGNQLIKRKMKHVDIGLLVSILILLALGLMMVLSASAPSALTYNGDSYFYFKSQAQNALLRFGGDDCIIVCGLSYLQRKNCRFADDWCFWIINFGVSSWCGRDGK